MKPTGGYVYADQRAAEDRVNQLSGNLIDVIDALTELNESIDSLKLGRYIAELKFRIGL